MFRQLRAHYWWAGMERECHSIAAACEKCGSTKSQATMSVPIGSAPTPTRPFEVIHLDHKGESFPSAMDIHVSTCLLPSAHSPSSLCTTR